MTESLVRLSYSVGASASFDADAGTRGGGDCEVVRIANDGWWWWLGEGWGLPCGGGVKGACPILPGEEAVDGGLENTAVGAFRSECVL